MSSNAPPPSASVPAPAVPAAKSKTAKTKAKSKTATKASGTQAKARKPARKKKTTSKSSGAAATQAILSGARAAHLDLAKQKAQAAARRSDPLWYRIEDVLPIVRDGNAMTSSSAILSEQVQVVEAALDLNGMSRADVTPQAMGCLLEQARRYAQELLSNAQDYAYSANRTEIMRADLLLASEMRPDHSVSVSTQLPKLNLIAQQVNRAPLPPIPSHCYSGVLLPPRHQQLTARTYDIVSAAQVKQKMVQNVPQTAKKATSSSSTQPSYGAARGRQIPIKLKEGPTSSSSPKPMDISPGGTTAATVSTSAMNPASGPGVMAPPSTLPPNR